MVESSTALHHLIPELSNEPDHPFNEASQGFNVLFCSQIFILINFMEKRNALRQKAFIFHTGNLIPGDTCTFFWYRAQIP